MVISKHGVNMGSLYPIDTFRSGACIPASSPNLRFFFKLSVWKFFYKLKKIIRMPTWFFLAI